MGLFKQGDNSCYFIHIPRTAGRYVSSLFESTDGVECKDHQIGKELYYSIDIAHLHYPIFLDICPQNIPHLAVVRNPYDKILSSLRATTDAPVDVDYNKFLQDEYDCREFLFRHIIKVSSHNNWFRPQHTFVSPTTSVWKYEWGFGTNFRRWVYEKTKIKLTEKVVEYERVEGDDQEPIHLNKKSQNNIKNFYKRDYNTFEYRR